jgi:hypothetical protein
MFFFTCRNNTDINPFCFTILRVSTVFYMVFYNIYYIILLIAYGAAGAEFSKFVVIILYAIFIMIYFVKCNKAIKNIENMVDTGYPTDCISNYIIVYNYIIALFSIFNVFTYGFISVFITISEVAFLIFFTMELYILRKDLKNLLFRISINPEVAGECMKVDENLHSAL